MKRLLLVGLIMFSALFSFSQQDPAALSILEKVESKAKSYKTISSEFEYIIKNAQEESKESYKGKVFIKGKKFRMELDGTITFSDGKTRWVYLEESNEVNISEVTPDKDLDFEEKFLVEPLSIFSIYKEGFKYTLKEPEKIGNKEYHVIDLSPNDLNKAYFKIRCWFTESNDLYSIKYFLKDGTRMTLFLTDFKTDEKLKDDKFIFNKSTYPGVEIIDLRE